MQEIKGGGQTRPKINGRRALSAPGKAWVKYTHSMKGLRQKGNRQFLHSSRHQAKATPKGILDLSTITNIRQRVCERRKQKIFANFSRKNGLKLTVDTVKERRSTRSGEFTARVFFEL